MAAAALAVLCGCPSAQARDVVVTSFDGTDVVGEPTVTLTYHGVGLPASTFVYAQVVDAQANRVVDGQVTPIPLVLDGRLRTVTRSLEVIAIRGRPSSDLRLQLVPSSPLYGPQRSAGSLTVSSVTSTLPLVAPAIGDNPGRS